MLRLANEAEHWSGVPFGVGQKYPRHSPLAPLPVRLTMVPWMQALSPALGADACTGGALGANAGTSATTSPPRDAWTIATGSVASTRGVDTPVNASSSVLIASGAPCATSALTLAISSSALSPRAVTIVPLLVFTFHMRTILRFYRF